MPKQPPRNIITHRDSKLIVAALNVINALSSNPVYFSKIRQTTVFQFIADTFQEAGFCVGTNER